MKRELLRWIAAVLLSITALTSLAEDVRRDEVPQLLEECEAQREANIAPLREQAIEDCVTKQRWDRERCESHNRTFGNARRNTNGSMRPGMFWDLPVCVKARDADRFFKANPRYDTYSHS